MAMAERGELLSTLPAGYEKVDRIRIEMTPDQRQRDAIDLVFRKFVELGSIRQVFLWFQHNAVALPVRVPGQELVWRIPVSPRGVGNILVNPIYAGAYVYGRRRQEVDIENGHKRVRRTGATRDREDWTVLLRDHHEGYITWEQFERNQELISDNITRVKGAVRNGSELLAGLLRCGHCDARIQIRDTGRAIIYRCHGLKDREGAKCISFGAAHVDAAVGEAVIEALQPLGVEAALAALTERAARDEAAIRLAGSALTEARYRAQRAQAQFEAVDPANHNVFHNLARKWEDCLSHEKECEARLRTLEGVSNQAGELTPDERDSYLTLGADLQRVWNHDSTTPQQRKRLVRAVLVEITATIKDREIHLLVHWKGGDHTELVVPRRRPGQHRWTTDAETVALVRDLARMLPDELIAGLLNRLGRKTSKGNSWTKSRVRSFRSARDIAVYREGERRDRGELILSEAAERLGVHPFVIRRLIRSGALPARQACKGAPWIIKEDAINSAEVQAGLSNTSPLTPNPKQKNFTFQ